MRKKKKHTDSEIAAKLRQADELLAKGELQSDVARALGVSVMTFHRWRKASLKNGAGQLAAEQSKLANKDELAHRVDELMLENSRLRKLVTDLILEKMKLEESVQSTKGRRQ
jgi:transposase